MSPSCASSALCQVVPGLVLGYARLNRYARLNHVPVVLDWACQLLSQVVPVALPAVADVSLRLLRV